MEIRPRYVPLRSDVRATLRQKTLLGETYVELTPGTRSAQPLREGGRIPRAAIAPSVQLDEIFRAFDPRTRRAFQTWMQQQASAIGPYARDVNAALGNLAPFAEDTGQLVGVLKRQQAAVQGLVSGTGEVFDALSERDGQLRGLIRGLDTVFATTGRARPRAARGVHGAADVRARGAAYAAAPGPLRRRHQPARRRSCGRRRASSRRP